MSITHDKNISNHINELKCKKSGVELPHPPYYNYIKIRNILVLFTFLLQHISIILTVLRFVVVGLNDLRTYHMVLQLYTFLTFKCITI